MAHHMTRFAGLLLALLALALPMQVASSPRDSSEVDDAGPVSVTVREPVVESVGVNFAPDEDEARISEDVRAKLSARGDILASCYALHAADESDPDVTVTVDWTITTSGEPVGFEVFSSMESLSPCIRRSIADLSFEHLDDSHPRARVRLRFQ